MNKLTLFIFIAFFTVCLTIPALASLEITSSNQSIYVLSGDMFSVNVQVQASEASAPVLEAIFDDNLFSIASPEKELNFWNGTFSADIKYIFYTQNWDNSTITFILKNDLESKELSIPIEVAPVYVEVNVSNNYFDVREDESFEVPLSIASENSNNVTLKLEYDSDHFETDFPNEKYLGDGTFVKDETITFKTKEISEDPDQIIKVKICSDKSCDEKEIGVDIKSLEITAESTVEEVSPDQEFTMNVDYKNFNYGEGLLMVNYDQNWFDLVGEKTRTISDDTSESIEFEFKMKQRAEGCPNTNFGFVLSTQEDSVTSEVNLTPVDGFYLDSDLQDKLVGKDEIVNTTVKIKAFGLDGGAFRAVYDDSYFRQINDEAKDSLDLPSTCTEVEYSFEFDPLKSNLGLPSSGEQLNYAGQNTISFEISSNDQTLIQIGKNIQVADVITEIDLENPEIGVPNELCKISVNQISSTGNYDTLNKRCRIILPPIEIICVKGAYNSTTNRCEFDPEFGCPGDSAYNQANEICEYSPDIAGFCDEDFYNAETDLCEFAKETICSDGAGYNNATEKCELGASDKRAECPEGTVASGEACEWTPSVEPPPCKGKSCNANSIMGAVVTAEEGDMIAVTFKATDIKDIELSAPEGGSAPRVIHKDIQQDQAVMIITYDDPGEQVLMVSAVDGSDNNISQTYNVNVEKSSWFKNLTGFYTFNPSYSAIGSIIFILVVLSIIIFYKKYQKMNPWEKRKAFRLS